MGSYIFIVFFLYGFVSTDDSLKLFGSSIFFLLFSLTSLLSKFNEVFLRYILFVFTVCLLFFIIHIANLPAVDLDWLSGSILSRFILQLLRLFLLMSSVFYFISIYSKYQVAISQGLILSSIFMYLSVIVQVALDKIGISIGENYLNESGDIRYGSVFGEPQILNFYALPGLAFSLMKYRLEAKSILSTIHIILFSVATPFCYSTAILSALILVFFLSYLNGLKFRILFVLAFIAAFVFFVEKSEEFFSINIRSITVLAGFELLKDNFISGIGIGLSPFYLHLTDIFSNFPEFDFSNVFRQNVMNSYIEVFLELGLVGIIVTIILVKSIRSQYLNEYHYESTKFIAQVYLLSAFSVGSVFYSSALLFIMLYFRSKRSSERV